MIRGLLLVLVSSAALLAPSSFAQDLEGLPSTGMEKAKLYNAEVLLRLGFTFASSVVPETVRNKLDRVAEILGNERGEAAVEIAGHTDSIGPEDYNQVLSEKRAAAVKAYLVERGIAAERINVVGYGEAEPRDTNDTVEGRRKNRRVEIRISG